MSQHSAQFEGQTILEHLNDLRIHLTRALIGLVLATVVSFAFAERVLEFLIKPYGDLLDVISPTEGIETYFKVALVCGVILSMPWILFQLWRFISPGLKASEKRYVYVFIPSATLLFLTGVAFAWLVLLPAAISFLSTFMAEIFEARWISREYITFATTFLLWIGVSFEMPLIIYFLARFGIVGPKTLREQWRFAIVGIAVLAAAITPSIDPVTMLLTMIPLLILYGMSIILAAVGSRQFNKTVALEEEL
ncbi:MAG: twin-arginine translocase subunit TatC [Candidatus Promineifilaceae bacterium]